MRFFFLYILFWSFGSLGQQIIELCPEESKTFTYTSQFTGDGVNTWTINGVIYNEDSLTYTFSGPGSYNIVLRRENGLCYAEETYQVSVIECNSLTFWVPNAFTPDNDEHNQTFGPVMYEGFDPNNFSFIIFDRWGEIIWETKDPNGRWDGVYGGNICQDGVYIWKIHIKIPETDKKIEKYGHLVIIR